jgi:hypothetical protein
VSPEVRKFTIREGATVELRAAAFNALNHTVFGTPTANASGLSFGRAQSTANSPRQLQLGFRLRL